HLRSPDGSRPVVADVQRYAQIQPVYDLTIDGVHTYHVVVGSARILVHNCGDELTSLDDLAAAAEATHKETSYTAAGHALTKKLGRPDEAGAWAHLKPEKTDEAGFNRSGQFFVEDLLTHPDTVRSVSRGRVDGRWRDDLDTFRIGENGIGARWTPEGKFVGFLT
ncbi:hypothetical protein ACWEIJ_27110, partial [Lentzea sp. NPDC004789]